jgi:hypothetical protein
MKTPRPLSFRTSLRLASMSLAAALALGGSACQSRPPRGSGSQAIHIPIMEASGKFFDNQLTADIRFGRAQFPDGHGRSGGSEGNGPRGDGRSPRGGGGGFGMSGGMGPTGMGGGGLGGGRHEGRGDRDSDGGLPPTASHVRTENNPAVQLHLTLTNHGTQPLEVEVLEFSSLLGNFAVNPAKVTIAPEATATFEPMTSRLGIPQGDLPLKVRLRKAGKTEEQTLSLKIISEDGAPV